MITFTVKGRNEPKEAVRFAAIWWPVGEAVRPIHTSVGKLDVTLIDMPEEGDLYIYAYSQVEEPWWEEQYTIFYHGVGRMTLKSGTYYYDYKTRKLQTWWQIYTPWLIGIGVVIAAIAFLQKK